MLEGPKTGRQVYRFLSPGRLWADRLYSLEVEFSPNPGESKSAYFQEDRWVRRLLNECGLNLPWVQPGVYLESESEWWKVSFTMRDKTLVWAAASTLTGQYYGGNTYTQRLDFTLNLAEQLNRVMEEITGHVPQEKISGYKELVVSIRNSLRDYGYGKKSARCLLSVESIPSEVRIEVSLKAKPSIGAVGSIHLKTSPDTNREELEQGIEWAFEDEGSLVGYNVVNMNKFRENLSMILDEMELADHTEDEGGPTIWMVDVYEENCMMIWRAEDVDDSSRTEGPNILADDLKELLDDPTERFRYRFMMDVVKELGVVENVDEVMNEQIPEVLQQIRRKGRTT